MGVGAGVGVAAAVESLDRISSIRTTTSAATPTPAPTPKLTPEGELLKMAEELAVSWSHALNVGNVDFLVEISGNPFFFGRRILASEAEKEGITRRS